MTIAENHKKDERFPTQQEFALVIWRPKVGRKYGSTPIWTPRHFSTRRTGPEGQLRRQRTSGSSGSRCSLRQRFRPGTMVFQETKGCQLPSWWSGSMVWRCGDWVASYLLNRHQRLKSSNQSKPPIGGNRKLCQCRETEVVDSWARIHGL